MKKFRTPLACALGVCILSLLSFGCTNKPEPPTVIPETKPSVDLTPAADGGDVSPVEGDASVPLPHEVKPNDPPKPVDNTELEKLVARVAVSKEKGPGYVIDDAVIDQINEMESDPVAKLIPMLASTDVKLARGAAVYLLLVFNYQREGLLDGFLGLLDSPDTTLRHLGLRAIKLLPPEPMKTAGPQLAEFVGNVQTTENNRADAARLFIRMGANAKEWLPELQAAAADDPSVRVRSACLYAISRVADPRIASAAYIRALKSDESNDVRRAAALRLGQLEPTDETPAALATALTDPHGETATTAAESLGRLGAPAAAATAIRLEHPEPAVRLLALIALAKMGQGAGAVLPQIEALVNDQDEQVQQAARFLVNQFRSAGKGDE